MTEFCQRNAVPHEVCGKVVVATDDAEVGRLRDLHQRGLANGLEGLQWLNGEELREIEPHVAGVAGLKVPQEGIVDYQAVVDALTNDLSSSGARCISNAEVKKIANRAGRWLLATPRGDFEADYLVNCAGLFCDKIAERFSYEWVRPTVKTFGFHGFFNFSDFLAPPELEALVQTMPDHMLCSREAHVLCQRLLEKGDATSLACAARIFRLVSKSKPWGYPRYLQLALAFRRAQTAARFRYLA
jgi:L-2-hydroxyglutarate oxidase LhgO